MSSSLFSLSIKKRNQTYQAAKRQQHVFCNPTIRFRVRDTQGDHLEISRGVHNPQGSFGKVEVTLQQIIDGQHGNSQCLA